MCIDLVVSEPLVGQIVARHTHKRARADTTILVMQVLDVPYRAELLNLCGQKHTTRRALARSIVVLVTIPAVLTVDGGIAFDRSNSDIKLLVQAQMAVRHYVQSESGRAGILWCKECQ